MKRKKEARRQILQVDAAFVCLFVCLSVTKRQNRLSLHGTCWQLAADQIRATFSANPRKQQSLRACTSFPAQNADYMYLH